MEASGIQTATAEIIVHGPINEHYEWIQYNNELRIIRCIDDDMYQMKSIIAACNSKKRSHDWFRNQSTVELLEEFGSAGNPALEKTYDHRENLDSNLRGYYVHRLLVNAVAMWASPRYYVRILKLLDAMASQERAAMVKENTELRQRSVPAGKEKNYKYMIYTQELPQDSDKIILNLVRCNYHSFYAYRKLPQDRIWFYRERLPIAMTPNEKIKEIVKRELRGSDFVIRGTSITTYKRCLPQLHQLITDYFNKYLP